MAAAADRMATTEKLGLPWPHFDPQARPAPMAKDIETTSAL